MQTVQKDTGQSKLVGLRSPSSSWAGAVRTVALIAGVLATAACASQGDDSGRAQQGNLGPKVQTTDPMEVQPQGSKPDWAPDIDPQMHAVIEQFVATEPPTPATQLSAFQFRNIVLPADAAAAVLKKAGIPPQEPKVDISHRLLPVGPEEGILTRIYTPLSAERPMPVVVYYHGGGWVIADLDTYEPSARALAERTGAIVVSVAYRQAPEHRFPTAHEDSFAAYTWVTENASKIGGDPKRIATAGESAGGNLAVAVPIMAKQRGVALPKHILSVYPIADGDVQSPTYDEYAKAKPLNRPLMKWFFDYYAPNWQSQSEELISLVEADLSGLPPTTIINAEIDPLRAEGGELADRMEAAGIDVVREVYPGVTHEFFGMAALLEQAVQAQKLAAERLGEAF